MHLQGLSELPTYLAFGLGINLPSLRHDEDDEMALLCDIYVDSVDDMLTVAVDV